jgi:4-hydroxy-3-methylbut-2-enyl diphosphate reductase
MSANPGEVAFPDAFGFCGGVRAASDLLVAVSDSAIQAGVPVYGYHAIVHNADVTATHEAAGVTFVNDINEIPSGSAVAISAHGASPEVFSALKDKSCETFDATCPLVTRTHHGVELARERAEKVLYVCKGKPGEVDKVHDEVAGMVGNLDYKIEDGTLLYDPVDRSYLEIGDDITTLEDVVSQNKRYRIITQTTLNADEALQYRAELETAIHAVQPDAQISFVPSGDVCRAVADRQNGVRRLFQLSPTRVVVVTDQTSKNGRSYVAQAEQLAEGTDILVHAVANAAEAEAIESKDGLTAITASASTPDETISEVAAIFGDQEVPPTDRSFTLPDAKPEVLAEKFTKLIGARITY